MAIPPRRPPHGPRTPTPSQILRESSADLRPLLDGIVDSEGDTLSKLLVLQVRSMEQVRGVAREVGHVHQRLDGLEAEVRRGHVCQRTSDIDDLADDVVEARKVAADTTAIALRVEGRLGRLEERDDEREQARDRRAGFWRWLIGLVGILSVATPISGTWWLASHASEDRHDHITINELRLAQKTLQVQVGQEILPRLDKGKDQRASITARLTMVEAAQHEVVSLVWELRGLHRGRVEPAVMPAATDR